jgi:hypothetical protein
MSTPSNELTGLGDVALDANLSTNAAQSLSDAGASFGELLLGVGNALAATQAKLTETSAATATALAATLVDVIAVQETIFRDDGSIAPSPPPITQKLPLINFVDPVFYEYPQVRVQGRFVISDIATESTSSASSSSSKSGGGLSFSFLPFIGSASGSSRSTSQNSSRTVNTDRASAFGQMRMYAQISPRSDVGVPKPRQIVSGPSLNIIEGEIKNLPPEQDGTKVRTMSVLIQLLSQAAAPISGKHISIDTDGAPWEFDGADTTNAAGNVTIKLRRTFPAPQQGAQPVDDSPKAVIVTARLGLVSNDTTVTF